MKVAQVSAISRNSPGRGLKLEVLYTSYLMCLTALTLTPNSNSRQIKDGFFNLQGIKLGNAEVSMIFRLRVRITITIW